VRCETDSVSRIWSYSCTSTDF